MNGVLGQPLQAIAFGDAAGEHGADTAVEVRDRRFNPYRLTAFQRWFGLFNQFVVERFVKAMVLLFAVENGDVGTGLGFVQDACVIQALGLPMVDGATHVELVHATNHLVEAAEAQSGHQPTYLLGDEEEVVDHVFGLSGKALAQFLILGRDTHRAGIEVAFAHHDAAFDNQRRGGKSEFVRTQQCADDDVTAGAHAAVDLDRDTPAQPVEHQRLVGFRQAQLPGTAGVADGCQRRRAGAAIVTGDGHVIGMGLGYAGGHGADADFGNQFHTDARLRVDILEVVDQLCKVLDGVNIMVRWRRNQADTRRRMAYLGNPLVDLVAG